MGNLVKLACPQCQCVVFEPEAALSETYKCLACRHSADIESWKACGAAHKKRPDWQIGIMAAQMSARRLAAKVAKKPLQTIQSYAGGFWA